MLSNIPYAEFYSVASFENAAAPIAVGTYKELDYFADLVHDNQVVAQTGISNEECLILFKLSWQELAEIVDTAKVNQKNDTQDKKTD